MAAIFEEYDTEKLERMNERLNSAHILATEDYAVVSLQSTALGVVQKDPALEE